MDEAITLISQGCKMAKNLEESLPNMANQPDHLFVSCTDIITVFSKAKENISKVALEVEGQQQLDPIASGVQEWLHSSHTPAMDLLHAQLLAAPGSSSTASLFRPVDEKMKGSVVIQDQEAAGGTLAEVVAPPRRFLGSGGEVGPVVVAATSGPRGSSSQRQRRRGDGAAKRVEWVAAPQMGNTEIPPEDGHTWRKYGQKAILHSRFPRSYFRCTHQKLYNCPAKKQVQRLDNDPNIFEITYRGDHTCHFSSTAPSVPPPSSHHHHLHQQQISTAASGSVHLGLTPAPPVFESQWLSMDITTGRPDVGTGFMGPISSTGTGAAGAGPSASSTPYGREPSHVEYLQQQPVADMADAMFNSGSSSNNSMDLIFCSMDKKLDSGERKN